METEVAEEYGETERRNDYNKNNTRQGISNIKPTPT